MIDIPLGKALVPVEAQEDSSCDKDYFLCKNCFFFVGKGGCFGPEFACSKSRRKDGIKVVYKLADYPPKGPAPEQ